MIKFTLNTLLALFLSYSILAQSFNFNNNAIYEKKTLTFEEANIVSSYYHQDGIHSAVTGGVGTEKLTDVANVIDFKLSFQTANGKKHSIGVEVGIDYYTSASTDNIDTKISSASSSDTRYYPSINYSIENLKTGVTLGANLAYSKEYDYRSNGVGFFINKSSEDKRTEFGARANVFLDTYTQFVPVELRSELPPKNQKKGKIGDVPRNTYDLSLHISRIFSERFHAALTMDFNYQTGLLSTPFHRVYFEDGSLRRETLPDQRFKIPIGIRANYFFGEKFIIRSFYRFYKDDWGMQAHTAQLEFPFKIAPMFSVSPFYRWNTQKGINYFAPKGEHQLNAQYFSSDYDLSDLNSHFYGLGLRIVPFKTIMNLFAFNLIEIRGGLYNRSDGMNAAIVSAHVQFKGF